MITPHEIERIWNAIRHIESAADVDPWACEIAVEAMKKQIPMKMPGSYTDYRCAVCGRRIKSGKGSSSFVRDNFCQRCGQAIDWEE